MQYTKNVLGSVWAYCNYCRSTIVATGSDNSCNRPILDPVCLSFASIDHAYRQQLQQAYTWPSIFLSDASLHHILLTVWNFWSWYTPRRYLQGNWSPPPKKSKLCWVRVGQIPRDLLTRIWCCDGLISKRYYPNIRSSGGTIALLCPVAGYWRVRSQSIPYNTSFWLPRVRFFEAPKRRKWYPTPTHTVERFLWAYSFLAKLRSTGTTPRVGCGWWFVWN